MDALLPALLRCLSGSRTALLVEERGSALLYPEADRDRVFDSGVTTADRGVGAGLGIVKRVADAHGWDVGITESQSGGARFEVVTDP